MKVLSDSYLYQVADYGREISNFLVQAERIDKRSDAFSDIRYEIKMRQVSPIILKVLESDAVVLCIDKKGLSKAFKVTYARDIKNQKGVKKAFIDCTGLIEEKNGKYKCKNIGILISYIIAAMTNIIYYMRPKAILTNNTLVTTSTEAFVDMMMYLFRYLKVPVSYSDNKERMSFVLSEYFQFCILGRDMNQSSVSVAKKVSKISTKDGDFLHTVFFDTWDGGNCNIKSFINKFAQVFLNMDEDDISSHKNRDVLDTESLVSRWRYAYGESTVFGLEMFVHFATALTDCYVGAFVNQQNTIEKIVKTNLVDFTNELLRVGSENS